MRHGEFEPSEIVLNTAFASRHSLVAQGLMQPISKERNKNETFTEGDQSWFVICICDHCDYRTNNLCNHHRDRFEC
jgi:hypothetical protein